MSDEWFIRAGVVSKEKLQQLRELKKSVFIKKKTVHKSIFYIFQNPSPDKKDHAPSTITSVTQKANGYSLKSDCDCLYGKKKTEKNT